MRWGVLLAKVKSILFLSDGENEAGTAQSTEDNVQRKSTPRLGRAIQTGHEERAAEDASPAGKTMTALSSLARAAFREQAYFLCS